VEGALGPSIVFSYVFLQSVHYMAWLAWIPDSVTRAQGSLTFRMTAGALRRDLGDRALVAIAVASLAVVAAACFGASRARSAYLSLAAFHGYLELAALSVIVTRGRGRERGCGNEMGPWAASSTCG
jgi:hypothetical protein